MKKIIIAFAAIAAAFSLVSCNKEQIETVSDDLTINISVAEIGGTATKAVKAGWAAGDKINIWYDSNVADKPDLVIAYDGSVWAVDKSTTVTGALPSASGTLKTLYICGKNLTSDYTPSDLTNVFKSPTMMFMVKEKTTDKVDGVNRACTIPLISMGSATYSFAGNVLTANIGGWDFGWVNNCQIVIANLPVGNWALRCDKLMPRSNFVLKTEAFASSNPSANEYVSPVDNADGKAFHLYTFKSGSSYVFELYNIDNDSKYSYEVTPAPEKALDFSGTKLNCIKIDFSKFTPVASL